MKIVYKNLRPEQVFNLCDPFYLPVLEEIRSLFNDKKMIWAPQTEPLRWQIREHYIRRFDEEIGHYESLEKSVLDEGFKNPILAITGPSRKFKEIHLPPDLRNIHAKKRIVCEHLGGSRLYVAKKHGLMIPCIISDFSNIFVDEKGLTEEDLKRYITDEFEIVQTNHHRGVNLRPNNYYHIEKNDYNHSKQVRLRKRVLREVRTIIINYLRQMEKQRNG